MVFHYAIIAKVLFLITCCSVDQISGKESISTNRTGRYTEQKGEQKNG